MSGSRASSARTTTRSAAGTSTRRGENLFGLAVTDYPELTKTKKEIDLLEKVYSLYIEVTQTVADYKDLLWADVPDKIEDMITKVGDFQNACKKMPKVLREYEAFVELKRTIDDFLETLPLIQQLSHPSMRNRHWTALMQVTGRQLLVNSDNFKLSTLLEADLLEFGEDVEDITNSAVKELQIEEKLAIIQEEWADCALEFAQFKNRGPIQLQMGVTMELMEKLEEAQMNLGSMLASRYVVAFKEEVSSWVAKLFQVSEILEQWVQVQAMWIYLEAVFTSGDIAKQMPQEAKRFMSIDKNWEKIMQKAYETRNVIQYCFGNDVLQNLLPHLLEQLEVCQKALSGYLDQKRSAFPRFYFVSDAVLLEVLSQGSNPRPSSRTSPPSSTRSSSSSSTGTSPPRWSPSRAASARDCRCTRPSRPRATSRSGSTPCSRAYAEHDQHHGAGGGLATASRWRSPSSRTSTLRRSRSSASSSSGRSTARTRSTAPRRRRAS